MVTKIALSIAALASLIAATPGPPVARVMIVGVAHLVSRHDIHNSQFNDDPLSAKRQAEVEDVVGRLARFEPTKVLIEADAGNPKYARQYSDYLNGTFTLTANEIYQFGFKLAKASGNSTIYPIDTDGPQLVDDKSSVGKNIDSYLSSNFNSVDDPVTDASLARDDAVERTGTYLDVLRYLNTDEAIRANASWYSVLAGMGRGSDDAGAAYVSQWYVRNTYVYSNIVSLIAPGDRVAVIIGAGHTYLLREFVRLNPHLEYVDPLTYLAI